MHSLTGRCNGAYNRQKNVLEDPGYATFPVLPPSVQQPRADARLEHRFAQPRGRCENTSTVSLVQSAWALVVGRVTNSRDVVFGVTISGEDTSLGIDNDDTSATTALLRLGWKRDQKVLGYLEDTQEQTMRMLSFDQRAIGKTSQSIAQTWPSEVQTLLLTQVEETGYKRESIVQDVLRSHQPANKYSLLLDISIGIDKIICVAQFDPRVIEPWMMQRLLEQLEFTIRQLDGANSDERLMDLEAVRPQELRRLWEWNGVVPESVNECFHETFGERAKTYSQAPAISAWDGELTYGELDNLTTKLARRLLDLGVGQGTTVPLYFEKSMWTTVALLGVVKAGGTFVFFDPSLPEQRLQAMAKQVKADLILTCRANYDKSLRMVRDVIIIDSDFLADLKDQSKLPVVDPSSIMYVVFTSGSTGTPKAATITHTNVSSVLHHQLKLLDLNEDARVYDFASYSFTDASYNVFMALGVGGCLCVPKDEDRKNRLTESIASLRANIIDVTPSVAQFLTPDDIPTVNLIIFGGENLRMGDVMPWWGRVRIANFYGQSECTTNGTFNVNAPTPKDATYMGKAAGHVSWIVDPEDHNQLMPIGCIGELLFEGPSVGHGYVGDLDKTAAAFVADPAWLVQGGPVDLGDEADYTQVKIRGQRVELGEVEHQMQLGMPEAKQLVVEVVVPSGENANPLLAAFVEIEDDGDNAMTDSMARILQMPSGVEETLLENLPTYMVPTVLFGVGKLPATATGKISRRLLREIAATFSAQELAELQTTGEKKRQPVTHMEERMQKLWSGILHIDAGVIGLDDNFFRLGGDSIAAMKVVGEARKLGIHLSVADIFQNLTLERVSNKGLNLADDHDFAEVAPFSLLSKTFDVQSFLEDASVQCQVDQTDIKDAYPCTPLQEGLQFLALKQPGDYIMQYVLELSPDISISRFYDAWEEMIKATPMLRTRIVRHGELGFLQVELEHIRPIEWIEAMALDDYLLTDRRRLMVPGTPLVRYALIKDETGAHRHFVWTLHHLLYDGWSLHLMFDALNRAYRGDTLQESPDFKRFIKYVGDQSTDQSSNYWRSLLADLNFAPFPELPQEMEQPQANQVIKYKLTTPKERPLDITIATLIQASWALVISRHTGSQDVVFGATVSGRNAPVPGVDGMAGPVFATVPVRIDTSNRAISQYLGEVQQQATERIPFEQTGLHQISKINQECREACVFQTLMVIQPAKDHTTTESALGTWRDSGQLEWINTYALVLEMQLGTDDVTTITARFDPRAVEPWMVEKLLHRLEFVMEQLSRLDQELGLEVIEMMTDGDLESITRWNDLTSAPVQQTRAWVLDRNNNKQLAPVGAVGQLALEVQKEDPELRALIETAALPNTDPSHQIMNLVRDLGDRGLLYKTGDLVRYAEDGSLVFTGRRNGPVKQQENLAEINKQRGQTATNAVEWLLQRLWAKVLDVKPSDISIDDDFFSIGGDSMSAVRLTAAARSCLMDICIEDIVREKTIARLGVNLVSSIFQLR
ncbi:Nonribosomal peptide synthetase dtxS1 [Cladobotryum mycophilum]|uniref:Nonribosomal peptide synthetase dtxS1 n=1 Tax=Cladobotryum mycophilum TaxID=491253 RepID=A0ABR0SWZ3_9HYPO